MDANGRGLGQKMQQTPVRMREVSVAFSRRNFVEDIQCPRLLRPLMANFSEFFIERH